jgi:hypothetical protein
LISATAAATASRLNGSADESFASGAKFGFARAHVDDEALLVAASHVDHDDADFWLITERMKILDVGHGRGLEAPFGDDA